ncbi:hypothetical protein A0U91_15955 (plasmid) [Acetobacter persici]|uniref:Uncharacterized protein n=1 Tax=Acetobacter persici TaxID=1076596 RepID=A0A1U9LJN2_9PROT|nr:hypothetical protein A0U91_15955 [Acetobacter persici]
MIDHRPVRHFSLKGLRNFQPLSRKTFQIKCGGRLHIFRQVKLRMLVRLSPFLEPLFQHMRYGEGIFVTLTTIFLSHT